MWRRLDTIVAGLPHESADSAITQDPLDEAFELDVAVVATLGSRVWVHLLRELGARHLLRTEIETLVHHYTRSARRA